MKALIIFLILSVPYKGIAQNIFMIEKEVPTSDVPVTALVMNVTDNFDEVIDNYKKFVELWKDCDAEFQHLVEDAGARLKALRGKG